MPQFCISDGVHYVSYVTGPRSLLLGVRFGPATQKPKVSVIRMSNPASEAPAEESIISAICAGVGRSFPEQHVQEVVLVDSDSAPISLYEHAAFLLADAVGRGESFQHANIRKA